MEMKEGCKETEAGVIPNDWESKRIGAICKLVNGRGFKPYEWKTSGLPIIRIQNLNGSDEYNYYEGHYDPKIEINHNQLLFAWSGSRGTSFGPHIWEGPLGLLNYHTWKVEVDEAQIAPEFFFYALGKLTQFIEGRAHGASALVHTQKWEMEGFNLPLPVCRKEQRAIATALSDVDALLESLDRLIAKKRDIKQAAMQQLLTGKTRLPGFEGEWEKKTLGEIATIKDGTHQTPKYVTSGVPFYSVEQVTSGDFKNTKYISTEEHRFLTRSFKIEKDDILMTRIGSIGDCKLIDWDVEASFYVSLALLKIIPAVSSAFIAQYSKCKAFKEEVELHSLPSAVPKKINLGPISNVIVHLPPTFEEQSAIATVLSDMDAEITALEKRRDKTKALKQGMMQELLTGKTRLI